jgi:hypothetical protein
MNAVARRNRTGMEKSRTLVLVATMRSPTIGSPDQTYLRARCAKLGRPRRATAPDFPACAASPKGTKELICVADPRQGWDPLLSQLFGLVPAHVPGGGGPQSGSRWSARSAARTNDLEADEDPPQTWPAGGEAKTLRFKSSAASWERRTCCGRQRRTCRRPA